MTDETEDLKAAVKELWEAAVTHCSIHYSEHIQGDPEFEIPDDPAKAIRVIAEYLNNAQ